MKNRTMPAGVVFVSAVLLLAGLCFSVPAQAQNSTFAYKVRVPEQYFDPDSNLKSNVSAPTASKSPALTAEQKAYAKVRDKCIKEYAEQKIPESQHHTFMNACLKENGITKAVHLSHRPPPPSEPMSK